MLKGTKHTIESIQKMRIIKLGKKMSEETKKIHRSKKVSEETKFRISIANKNKIFSLEHRKKLSEAASNRGTNNRHGYKWPEEGKEKIRQTLKGRKLSEETKERMRNKIISFETRKKMSNRFKGKLNPRWNGGSTEKNIEARQYFEYVLWRKAIYKRDNYACRICNKKGGYLDAHHIKSFKDYPELRTAIDNGITLCKVCHRRQHLKIKEA